MKEKSLQKTTNDNTVKRGIELREDIPLKRTKIASGADKIRIKSGLKALCILNEKW